MALHKASLALVHFAIVLAVVQATAVAMHADASLLSATLQESRRVVNVSLKHSQRGFYNMVSHLDACSCKYVVT